MKISFPHIHLKQVDSTNLYAQELITKINPPDGFAVFADYQTAGKGQYGRNWESASGKNLLVSFIFNPYFIPIDSMFLLHQIASLSIIECLSKYITQVYAVKWPNDIYVSDQKIAGILIQNIIRGSKIQHTIMGIGLNINQEDFGHLKQACSLYTLTGKAFKIKEILCELHQMVLKYYMKIQANPKSSFLEAYNLNLYKLNETISFSSTEGFIHGKILGVDKEGKLILESHDNIQKYTFGEINWNTSLGEL
ncbi:MAG: biotin--[acetyl-CoA-carboxylase] ligase [Bacteroidota bacterium]|nr:biotin--[acetyl-CoA-carboxylase] ligase [Bacteroidota bacterium]